MICFVVLLIVRRLKNINTGQICGIYFIWYGIERFIIESFRSDSLMLGPLKIAQIVSILSLILGIYLFTRNINNSKKLYKEDLLLKEK